MKSHEKYQELFLRSDNDYVGVAFAGGKGTSFSGMQETGTRNFFQSPVGKVMGRASLVDRLGPCISLM